MKISRTSKRVLWVFFMLVFSGIINLLTNKYPNIMLPILGVVISISVVVGLWWYSGKHVFPNA